jgi:hypothetical protein
MPKLESVDIELEVLEDITGGFEETSFLAGDTLGYIIARKNGVPQLQLGHFASELGQKTQISTIPLGPFTGNMGQLIAADPTRYLWSDGLDASCEGFLDSVGDRDIIHTFTNCFLTAAAATIQPDLTHGSLYPTIGANVLGVVGKTPFYFNATTGVVTALTALTGDHFHSGNMIGWDADDVLISVCDANGLQGTTSFKFQTASATPSVTTVVTTPTAYRFQKLASFGNRIWFANVSAAGVSHIYWTTGSNGFDFAQIRGPFTIRNPSQVSAIFPVGPYIMVCLDNGVIGAIDQDGVFAPVVANASFEGIGRNRGFGTKWVDYLGAVAVPHGNGVLLFLSPSDINEIGPGNKMQSNLSDYQSFDGAAHGISGTNGLAAYHNELYAHAADDVAPTFTSPQLMKYVNGSWHGLGTELSTGSFTWGLATIIRERATKQLMAYSLVRDGNSAHLVRHDLSKPNHTSGAQVTEASSRRLRTSVYLGRELEGIYTKRFIRLRGHAYNLGSNDDGLTSASVYYMTDVEGTEVLELLGTIENNGIWTLPFPASMASFGKTIQFMFEYNLPAVAEDDMVSGYLSYPIFADFEFVPEEDDYVRIPILASEHAIGVRSGQKRMKQTRENVIKQIQPLIGKIALLKMDNKNTVWTVLIEGYNTIEVADNIVLNQGEAIVEVLCRRIDSVTGPAEA